MWNLERLEGALLDSTPRESWYKIRRRLRGKSGLKRFDADHPCVFVLSTGRVGTKTLAALFRLAPNLFAVHEPHPLIYNLSRAAYEFALDGSLGERLMMEALHTARQSWFDKALAIGRGYVETSPQVTFLAPTLCAALPEARFVHVVRSPRDIVRSGMRRGWYVDNTNDPWRLNPRAGDAAHERWTGMDAFRKIAWLWAETNRWILEFTSQLPDAQHVRLRSEDLFAGDMDAIGRMFGMANTETPVERQVQRVLRRRLNRQDEGEFPEHAKWSADQVAAFQAEVQEVAELLGYAV